MTHFIDRVLEPAVWFLADWSLRWAVVIAVLAVLLALLRPRRASIRYQVCLLVLLAGLLLPAVPRWGAGWPTRPAAPQPPAKAVTEPAHVEVSTQLPPQRKAKPPAGASTPEDPPDGRAARAVPPPADEPQVAPGNAAPAGQEAEPLGTRRLVFLGLSLGWVFGVLVLLVRWASGWLLLGRLRRTAANIEGPSADLFAACRTALGLRRPATLATHPAIRSPITFGFLRPIVLVPPGWSELPEPVRRGTLLHELAHLARGDDWWAVLLELVRTAFFFHPPVWWLLNRIERERELLCDEAAVARGVDPHDYARMLLEFARRRGRLAPAGFVGLLYPLRFGRRRTVKARIHHLLEDNMERWLSPLPARRTVALGCVVLGLALGLGSIRVRALPPQTPAPPVEPKKQPPSLLDSSTPLTALAGPKKPPASRKKTDSAKALYRIKPYDVLQIQATPSLLGVQIQGFYLVEADGRVDLGLGYGRVAVGGLTLDEAMTAVQKHLQGMVKDVKSSVGLAGWVTKWQNDPARKDPFRVKSGQALRIRADPSLPGSSIDGLYVVDPDGNVVLGPGYGKVDVAGRTVDQVTDAIRKRLAGLIKGVAVSVAPGGWEKDWQKFGEEEARPPTRPPEAPKTHREELRYDGKDFDQWRTEMLTELKPDIRVDGLKALSAFGANGYAKEATVAVWEMMRGYDMPAPSRDDEKVLIAGFEAVKKIGPAAVPELRKALKDDNRNARRFAVDALIGFGPDAKAAVPDLKEATKDEDSYVHSQAIVALTTIDLNDKGLVPILIDALKDPQAQYQAIAYLGALGPEARAAAPALAELAKKEHRENKTLASEVVKALVAIRPIAKTAVPALVAAINDVDQDTQRKVVELLGSYGPEARAAVPVLTELLQRGGIGPAPARSAGGPKTLHELIGEAVRNINKK